MDEKREAKIRAQLARVAAKQRELLESFHLLLTKGNGTTAELERAQREQSRLAAEQTRLLAELRIAQLETPQRFGSYSAAAGQRPMREQVLEMLDEIGVPSAPRTISEFAAAYCSLSLPPTRFASLRRDEMNAYKKNPSSRPSWVVPAINAFGLTALPRAVASSSWEPERRLIGSRTPRVNHLRTLLALLRSRKRTKADDQRVHKLDALIVRYASTVPGALDMGSVPDHERVNEAAVVELGRIEPLDLEERRQFADQLRALSPSTQLWGRPALTPVESKAGSAS